MNILFLTRRFYPQIGGVEKHALMVGKVLLKMNHEVTVIAEDEGGSATDELVDGITVKRIKTGKNDWFKKFRIWKELFELQKLIKHADVIHCHDVFFWYIPFRILFPFKKVYITFHGYETKFPPSNKAIIVRKISEILSYGNICIGDYIKKWYHTKPDYISYGGVELKKSSAKLEIEINSIMRISFIGRLEKDLGINTYLKALDLFKRDKLKIYFTAYGEGLLSEQIKKYGKVNKFNVKTDEIIENSDIVFCSSYLLMLEALGNKKIVIAVFENALKEEYLKNSPFSNYVYICKDANEVSEVVKSVLVSPWKSDAMVNNGYAWAKDQTWEKATDIYLELWKK